MGILRSASCAPPQPGISCLALAYMARSQGCPMAHTRRQCAPNSFVVPCQVNRTQPEAGGTAGPCTLYYPNLGHQHQLEIFCSASPAACCRVNPAQSLYPKALPQTGLLDRCQAVAPAPAALQLPSLLPL